MTRNPKRTPKRTRVKSRPYEKNLSFLYNYKIESDASTQTELKLYRNRYNNKKVDKIVKDPFKSKGFLGLRRK